ncbi:IMPACT family member YigZ [Pandoraea morbifera]|uniref:IMPACT family member YigZ n=1 Tax=Pandoraea morbifera TaxID=2508300 RepID=A0A5E4T7G2_9BURK|nr:YigZ family protein [Pandoraea morbifera]VVD84206.1 IMPACT family member YigZ [Pandoraea morbifera]
MYALAAPVETELEIRKSRFIGIVMPVASREAAMRELDALRVRYPNATHYCWVLLCDGASGFDDDGEPGGTAAKPMYNVLMHKGLTNVFAVVVRYYGGIKLGAGGLTRAYGQAVSEALKLATLTAVEPMAKMRYRCAFAHEAMLRRLAERHAAQVLDVAYDDAVTLQLCLRARDVAAFEADATEALSGGLERCGAA